jgi:class 3 adenylate cyclase
MLALLVVLYDAVFGALLLPHDDLLVVIRKLVLVLGLVTGAMVPLCTCGYYGYLMASGDASASLPVVIGISLAGAVVWQGAYWFCRATKTAPNWLMELWLFAVFEFLMGMTLTVPAFPSQVGALALTVATAVVETRLMPLHLLCATAIFWVNVYNTAYGTAPSGGTIVTVPQPHLAAPTETLLLGIIGYFIAAFIGGVVFGIATEFRRISSEQVVLQRICDEQEQLYIDAKRDTTHAPTGGAVAVLFTDIQDSTKLWGNAPLSMGVALDTHHEVIRRCIDAYQGYEVKTAGDSFMIAVGDEERAMRLAIGIQTELMKAAFPTAIEAIYAASTDEELDVIDDNPESMATGTGAWNGPRVRIGIHVGKPDVVFDDVTKGYDYYGPMVNIAARVESVAVGGQICCTREFVESQPLGAKAYTTASLGLRELKGVPMPVEVFEVNITEFSGVRAFAVFTASCSSGRPDLSPVASMTYELSPVTSPCNFDAARRTFASVLSPRSASPGSASAGSAGTSPRPSSGAGHRLDRLGRSGASDFGRFLAAMLLGFRRSTDRDVVLSMVCRAWRVQKTDAVDDMYEALARRIGASVVSQGSGARRASSPRDSFAYHPASFRHMTATLPGVALHDSSSSILE